MAYVAVKGGKAAIAEAERLLGVLRSRGADAGEDPVTLAQIENQLHFLHGLVMSEGGVHDPELAALALKQSLGDPLEASFFLRAFRSTRPRVGATSVVDTANMRVIRRISSAFKEIPGGQILGATPDYTHRLFDFTLMNESRDAFAEHLREWMGDLELPGETDTLPKVIDFLRVQGLVAEPANAAASPYDITREPIVLPLPRSAALSLLSRGQQGGLLALAYSSMRGFGSVHPTIAELRVGYCPVYMPHPATGEPTEAGEVLVTECEALTGSTRDADGKPKLTLGYGLCFGHNEVKAISMAMLDRSLRNGKRTPPGLAHHAPCEDEEFVLLHIDGVDAAGFCIHYKLPHYVTFQTGLDNVRQAAKPSASPVTEVKSGDATQSFAMV